MLWDLRAGIGGRDLAGHRHQHTNLVFPPIAVTRLLLVFLGSEVRSLDLHLILRGQCPGNTAVEDLQTPSVHLDDCQVDWLIDGRSNLLHQREIEICLDLAVPLRYPLLADSLGNTLDLLLLDREAGQCRKGLAALAEGWVLDSRVDNHPVHGRTIITAVDPQ